jgi:hypothetical protein
MNKDNAADGAPAELPFPAAFLEHATEALEAIGSLMEKIQRVGGQGGLDDAQMLTELRKLAGNDAERNILDTVLEMAALLKGEAPPAPPSGAAPDQPPSMGGGRFRDLA